MKEPEISMLTIRINAFSKQPLSNSLFLTPNSQEGSIRLVIMPTNLHFFHRIRQCIPEEKETFKEEILDSDNTRGIFNIQGKVDMMDMEKVDMEKVDLALEKARVKVLEEEEGTEADFNHFRNQIIWPK